MPLQKCHFWGSSPATQEKIFKNLAKIVLLGIEEKLHSGQFRTDLHCNVSKRRKKQTLVG